MNKKIIVFLFFVVFALQHSRAQISAANANSGVSSGSGQIATSPGSNIYSPDLFSGSVNVNIPIYNYSIDGVDLGVSLSYNTLGIKVDQVASSVGLGWTLNTGGIITREMHGVEDELREAEIDTPLGSGPDNRVAALEQRGNWVDASSSIPWYMTPGTSFSPEEPDVFTAVFGGRTISFSVAGWSGPYYNSTMTVFTSPKRDIQIDIMYDNANIYSNPSRYNRLPLDFELRTHTKILRFKITDEFGNQFFFDRGEFQSRTYSYKTFHPTINFGDGLIYEVPNSWFLKKVITYTGAVTSYTYEDDYYSYPSYRNQQVKERSQYFDPTSTSTIPVIDGSIYAMNDEISVVMHPQRLMKINYPNGDVLTFNSDGNTRLDRGGGSPGLSINTAVSSISIQKGYDGTVSNSFTYKFNYAYFNSDYSSPELPYPSASSSDPLHNLRLKLKGIDKIGTDGFTTENYYNFDYYSAAILPPRLSMQSDCYGYFNNATFAAPIIITSPFTPSYITSLTAALYTLGIPLHTFTFIDHAGVTVSCTYGISRAPNWNYAQANLLNKITNGMGGSVEFSYKDHNLTNPPDFSATSIFSSLNTGYFNSNDVDHYWHTYGNYGPLPDMNYLSANDGVCIDKIVCKDGFNSDNTTTTSFDFSDGSSGPGGVRFFPAGYFWYPTYLGSYHGDYVQYIDDIIIEKIYQNSFVTPMDLINGASHGYTHARATTTGYGGAIVSDKAYTFTNIEPQSNETITNTVTHTTTSPNWSRLSVRFGYLNRIFPRATFDKQYLGLLKEMDEYDNAGHILSKTINKYDKRLFGDSLTSGISNPLPYYGYGSPSNDAYYTNFTNSMVNLTETAVQNFSGASMIQTIKDYTYDNDGSLLTTTVQDSKGNRITESNTYSYTHVTQFYPPYVSMNFNVKYLTQKDWTLQNSTVNEHIKYSDITTDYDPIWAASHWYDGLGNLRDADYTTCEPIQVTGSMGVLRFNKVHTFFSNTPLTTIDDPHKLMAKHFRVFDDHNNVLETGYNNDQNFSSAVWDTRIGEKVADVKNAQYADIAYTSFEGNFNALGVSDYNKGNWDFDPTNIILGSPTLLPMTGRYYFNLTGSVVQSVNAPSVKTYNISFWYRGTMPNVTVGAAITLSNQLTVGSWSLATGTFTGNSTSHVQVSTSGTTYIDELRMAPSDASMDTYTYEPLIGVSSHCDERNNIIYFTYDPMGRLYRTIDIYGNIISETKTVVQGSDY